MRLNHKQEELIAQLAKEIEEKFPEVKFVEVGPSPESENTLWLDFTKPEDEDRLIELNEYAGERAMDILLDYGYHFVVLATVANGKSVSLANQWADSSPSMQWKEHFMSYQAWLDKANENLAAAQLCLDNGHFNACANRLYYAMFQAGIAVLVKHKLLRADANVGHDWLQTNFSGQLIHHRKVFPAKFRSYLSEAYLLRVVADYEMRPAGKDNVSRQLKKAKEFVTAINSEASHDSQS